MERMRSAQARPAPWKTGLECWRLELGRARAVLALAGVALAGVVKAGLVKAGLALAHNRTYIGTRSSTPRQS